jgi:hypothetical protein
MQTKLLRCDVCGCLRAGPHLGWYTLHFGATYMMLVEPDELAADAQRVGKKHACSRQCLTKLVLAWCETRRAKREEPACALTS